MPADLLDILESLKTMIDEETALLGQPGMRAEREEVARVKIRLTGQLEGRTVELDRATPGWREALAPDLHTALVAAAGGLVEAARRNAERIARQLDLSDELIMAIVGDARRRAGASSSAYGAGGELWRVDRAAPISVNTNL